MPEVHSDSEFAREWIRFTGEGVNEADSFFTIALTDDDFKAATPEAEQANRRWKKVICCEVRHSTGPNAWDEPMFYPQSACVDDKWSVADDSNSSYAFREKALKRAEIEYEKRDREKRRAAKAKGKNGHKP
jgi:hypothetical protein